MVAPNPSFLGELLPYDFSIFNLNPCYSSVLSYSPLGIFLPPQIQNAPNLTYLFAENSSVCCLTPHPFLYHYCVSIRSSIYTFPSLPLLSQLSGSIYFHFKPSLPCHLELHTLSWGLPEPLFWCCRWLEAFPFLPTSPQLHLYIILIFIKTHSFSSICALLP